jgi:hypothetical protein
MNARPQPGNLALLQSLADEKIVSLVRDRLLYGKRLFYKNTLEKGITRADAKLVLLMCLVANPNENLTTPEMNLITGRQQEVCDPDSENSDPDNEKAAPTKKTKKSC